MRGGGGGRGRYRRHRPRASRRLRRSTPLNPTPAEWRRLGGGGGVKGGDRPLRIFIGPVNSTFHWLINEKLAGLDLNRPFLLYFFFLGTYVPSFFFTLPSYHCSGFDPVATGSRWKEIEFDDDVVSFVLFIYFFFVVANNKNNKNKANGVSFRSFFFRWFLRSRPLLLAPPAFFHLR